MAFYCTLIGYLDEDGNEKPLMPPEAAEYGIVSGEHLRAMDRAGILPPGYTRVPGTLKALLWSCQAYPPAEALAMECLEHRKLSEVAFLSEMERLLQYYLAGQRSSGHILLQAARGFRADFLPGHFYWVLGLHQRTGEPEAQLRWVCSDLQIYTAPIADFDVDADWVVAHFQQFQTRS